MTSEISGSLHKMSLRKFAEAHDAAEAIITVLNGDSHPAIYRLLTRLFDNQAVTIKEVDISAHSFDFSDTVIVQKESKDGSSAISPLDSIRDALLLVNSDIYITGSRSINEIDTPDVLTALDEVPFTVTGYPNNHKEKLLLIEMSRYIEAMAWQAGEGRLDTGFQYLSRLDDEIGTKRVYENLGTETTVNTHVYGVPDSDQSVPNVEIRTEDCQELRQSWFVAYQSSRCPFEAAALIAIETDQHSWEGYWTYDAERVGALLDYLDLTYGY